MLNRREVTFLEFTFVKSSPSKRISPLSVPNHKYPILSCVIFTLYVPNYRRPEVRRYAFERSGAEFIMAVPGPADTAVGTRMMLSTDWS